MNSEKILRGVPRARYGAFGGITPFPICVKAVSDFLGDELDYTFAIISGGGAFRFVWDTTMWNPGNVDIMLTYEDAETVFRNCIQALGREFRMLWRAGMDWHPGSGTKNDFMAFIREQIDLGRPVISLGPIGPAEAGVITGYKDDGNTLLGWSVFQDWAWKNFSDEGYFVTDKWWDTGDFYGVMSFGEITGQRFSTKKIIENAVLALRGRSEGNYAKGIAAYDYWKNAIHNVTENDFIVTGTGINDVHNVMMCQGDATDCLIDGRRNACKYFTKLAEENPGQPLYGKIAEWFGIVAKVINSGIYATLGGYERGPQQIKALAQPENRSRICDYIDEMKNADMNALVLMEELLGIL